MTRFKNGLNKIKLNLQLDLKWLTQSPLPKFDRFLFLSNKYQAILKNESSISFLGGRFFYDNRLTPALLTDYVFEIDQLTHLIPFRELRSVLDIGANVGQFSYTLKRQHPHLTIYSFEPNPEIFDLLQKNSSGFKNWFCKNLGVGRNQLTLPFFFVSGKSAQGSVFQENAEQGLLGGKTRQVNIQVAPLSPEVCDRLGIPASFDLIKIDVEGAEREVLWGLKEINWKYLYLELSKGRAGELTLEESVQILESAPVQTKVEVLLQEKPHGPAQNFQVLLKNTQQS